MTGSGSSFPFITSSHQSAPPLLKLISSVDGKIAGCLAIMVKHSNAHLLWRRNSIFGMHFPDMLISSFMAPWCEITKDWKPPECPAAGVSCWHEALRFVHGDIGPNLGGSHLRGYFARMFSGEGRALHTWEQLTLGSEKRDRRAGCGWGEGR